MTGAEMDELLAQVESGALTPPRLTFAAESLGEHPDKARALAALLPLLKHEKAYVREGALLGLAALATPAARDAVQAVELGDASETLRAIAGYLLADWEA